MKGWERVIEKEEHWLCFNFVHLAAFPALSLKNRHYLHPPQKKKETLNNKHLIEIA